MAVENESLSLDVNKAASSLQTLSSDFTKLVNAINGMTQNLTDLQNCFYSPADKDSTLIYEECKKNIGVGTEQGLYPAVKGAHQWCSAVDQYVQDQEYKQSNGNPYDD
ncbi:MAG: hypothetical protein K2G03_05020 [Bacilli bacterium]|nr:hypothetical protein [Bacilli bacterium]MDE6141945.1 hypothetical protein [Bacilli bacterium]